MKIAESLGISAEEQKEEPKMLTKYGNTHGVDSSMEIDQFSMTDSSSYVSNESSFSIDSKERSCSNDLRKSFDS